jgi:hypothetical protein
MLRVPTILGMRSRQQESSQDSYQSSLSDLSVDLFQVGEDPKEQTPGVAFATTPGVTTEVTHGTEGDSQGHARERLASLYND